VKIEQLSLISILACILSFQLIVQAWSKADDKKPQPEIPRTSFLNILMIDGHTHDIVPRGGKDPVQAGIERLEKAGIGGIILSLPLNNAKPENVIQQIINDIELVKKYAIDKNIRIKFVNRFSMQDKSSPIQILLSVEYFDSLFDPDLKHIKKLKAIGISSITLIDNEHSRLSEMKNGRTELNEFGRKIVQSLNDTGIVIDISHLPEPLQLSIIIASKKPVFASHSNIRSVADAGRNLSDTVLCELIGKGGIVLFTFDKEYLYGDKSAATPDGISKLIEHIDYTVKKYGIDFVGIGSDYGGSGRNAPSDLFKVDCFQVIANRLMNKGYSIEQVKKIMGGNLIAFFSIADKASWNEKN
jgi:membrane dipeptidase